VKATRAPESVNQPTSPPDTWQSRINLARSILNQREPSEHTATLAKYALDGATIEQIRALDIRAGR
jgi:hypothetical protein